jgi:hypothetical protein
MLTPQASTYREIWETPLGIRPIQDFPPPTRAAGTPTGATLNPAYFPDASARTSSMRAELSNWFTVGRPVLGSSKAWPGL